jgi:hypothetical protein
MRADTRARGRALARRRARTHARRRAHPGTAASTAKPTSGPVSLEQYLEDLGLGEYLELFTKERISLQDLALLHEDDLKALGVPMGPRRRMQAAFAKLSP